MVNTNYAFKLENICLDVPQTPSALVTFKKNPIVTLLSDINLEIHKGDKVGLLGANGSGKSTLMRVLGGVYLPTSGKLTCSVKPVQLFDVGFGIEGRATVLENIKMKLFLNSIDRKEVDEYLAKVLSFAELGSDILDKEFSTLSTGQRLRVVISIALNFVSDCYLLDEWIGAGDSSFKEKVNNHMSQIISKESTVVLASHNQDLIERQCSKVALVSGGKVVEFGSLDDVKKKIKS